MKCYYPQVKPDVIHPCGQCLPCRINQRNARAGRILLESTRWSTSYFITLTHATDTVRFNENGDLVLNKPDLQNFLKRLRKNIGGQKFKYHAVGEYGDKLQRPHYHLALFIDMDPEQFEQEVKKAWSIRGQSDNDSLNLSQSRRLIGLVDVKLLNPNRAQYVAQYTMKKIVSEKLLPDGAPAEFAIMSKHPPIGHESLIAMANRFTRLIKHIDPEYRGCVDPQKVQILKNIQRGCYRLNGRLWPLDRYGKNLILETLVSKSGLSDAKRQLLTQVLETWKTANSYDINQEAKARHLALVKTEKWKKKRQEACKQSNL